MNTIDCFPKALAGAGQGLCPFWGWSALGYVMAYEAENGYDPAAADCAAFHRFSDLTFDT